MFPTFTGSSRPKRQVNLSGRTTNPFAGIPTPRQQASPQNTQNALAHAQQERLLRQRERERPPAAKRIQRVWRGHSARKTLQRSRRIEWDAKEERDVGRFLNFQNTDLDHEVLLKAEPYESKDTLLHHFRMLTLFVSASEDQDIQRMGYFIARLLSTERSRLPEHAWGTPPYLDMRLTSSILEALESRRPPGKILELYLDYLSAVATASPGLIAKIITRYYRGLAAVAAGPQQFNVSNLLTKAVLTPLEQSFPNKYSAYEGFVSQFLLVLDLPSRFAGWKRLTVIVNANILADALDHLFAYTGKHGILQSNDREQLLWLLAYFVDLHRAKRSSYSIAATPDAVYIRVVSILITYLAEDIGSRIDDTDSFQSSSVTNESQSLYPKTPLPTFVRDQILGLVDQGDVSQLLAQPDAIAKLSQDNQETANHASALANYALTLLRVFPRKSNEIRMWLFLGSTHGRSVDENSVPAIKYFWQAVSHTKVFKFITKDPRKAVEILKVDTSRKWDSNLNSERDSDNQEWNVILLFLELYTFVLRLMDDDEFFLGPSPVSNIQQNRTRQSALALDDVKDLTVFLKHLAFAMYWNASDLEHPREASLSGGLASYFGNIEGSHHRESSKDDSSKAEAVALAGVTGMTMVYLKGMVTGLLRMVYERDSRRKFLPDDHWLMTKYFDMGGFIQAVVKEEEHRHQVEEANEDDNGLTVSENIQPDSLIGTQQTNRVRNFERLKQQQRMASRKRYLEAITPRLEILQNMPFFIPFVTRVQIFREFVTLDQLRRRGGLIDPDDWRFSMMSNSFSPDSRETVSKHRAKVRRESVFDDALQAFYDLGEGLKEPIEITFEDKFGTVEAGIDGGGVTKEFLMSITSEAFKPQNGHGLFVENDQHLLYPNPAAVDEREDILRAAGIEEGSAEWIKSIRDLRKRYEFLGRIVGKCLYEGILVDMHFAGFFLLKWALTGGTGLAPKESSYRANVNDLRDLDESLYQGLLKLKNYAGNAEDFSLSFEVTDVLSTPTNTNGPSGQRTITRELRRGGSNIAVTNENKLVYIWDIARHRLQTQQRAQTDAFLRGLGAIISPSWLSMFNQAELQTLVGGDSSEIDVADLRRNTLYGGLYVIGDDNLEHPSINLFWRVMQSLSDTDRRKVLKFVTSTPRAPLLGFDQLNPRFSIRDSGHDQTRLPTTSTCVNLLKLPIYQSAEVLRDRLLYAVNSGAGFNLS